MTDDKKPKLPPPLPGKPRAGAVPPGGPKPPGMPGMPKLPPPGAPPRAAVPPAPPSTRVAPPAGIAGDVELLKRQMEGQIAELQQQLSGEREKQLLARVREHEEEAMSAKVEVSLKDIQERLRREKREQDMQEQLTKAEQRAREVEQRLSSERQTWVEALRTQISKSEEQDHELEHQYELQMQEMEKRWHEEKLAWSQALKSKEQELAALRAGADAALEKERDAAEKRIGMLESERAALQAGLREAQERADEDKSLLQQKMETREREQLALKAQQAMLAAQARQEKEKAEHLRLAFDKIQAEHVALAKSVDEKDKENYALKSQFALYQAKTKSETERLSEERGLMQEQLRAREQDWEQSFREKQEKLLSLAEMAKAREMQLRQELDTKEQAIRQAHDRLQAQEAQIQNLVRAERDVATALAAQKAELEALRAAGGEKERRMHELSTEIIRLQQKEQATNLRIVQMEQESRDLKARAAGQKTENDRLSAALAQKDRDIAAGAAEVRALQARAHDTALEMLRRDQEIKDQARRLDEQRAQNEALRAAVAAGEQSLKAAQEKFAQDHAAAGRDQQSLRGTIEELTKGLGHAEEKIKTLTGTISAQARDLEAAARLQAQLHQITEEHKSARNMIQTLTAEISAYEEQNRDLADKIKAQAEEIAAQAGLEAKLRQREREIDKIHSDYQLREKDAQIQLAQKDAQDHAEMAHLKEQITELSGQVLEKDQQMDVLAAKSQQAVQDRDDIQRELQQARLAIEETRRLGEADAANTRAARAAFEMELRRETEMKISALAAQYKKEKEESVAALTAELERLKAAVRQELTTAESHWKQERAQWQADAAARLTREQELRRQIAALEEQLARRASASTGVPHPERRADVADAAATAARETELRQQLALLQEQLLIRPPAIAAPAVSDDVTALRRDIAQIATQMNTITHAASPATATPVASPQQSAGTLGRLWKKLNEPVIEIHMD